MKVLFVASEGHPFIKTGGLGDVIGSLPIALNNEGVETRIVMPLYGDIPQHFKEQMRFICDLKVPVGWRKQYCGLKTTEYKGITYYFIDNEYYFKRPGYYGYYDDAERFSFFCRAVLECLPHMDFRPDILHCHDWQTGLVSLFKQAFYGANPDYTGIRTVFTIHNLAYQGIFPHQILGELLGLGYEYFTYEKLEFYDCVNYMKAGIVYSDLINTVSPTYAREIQYPFYGEKLDGLLRHKSYKLSGILNGIDTARFNPATDPALFVNYKDSLADKLQNKLKLQELLGFKVDADIPLLAMITRLVRQKGLDLLAHILEELLQENIQLVVLGTGEQQYEGFLSHMAYRYPAKMAAKIMFDETLAQRIYAGSDMFLMPSLFEPCGLGQLIAMRYGSVPIVRETGGLKDTVSYFYQDKDGNYVGNGFSFANYNAHELLFTIKKAMEVFKNKELWAKVVHNALNSDFSWEKSAKEYIKLYKRLE
ncbi:MAG TPA: glycogen synthase GlgA [Firmicutes bacterium]|nr:glycogen synthase GlgA [Bacillota bacterium]